MISTPNPSRAHSPASNWMGLLIMFVATLVGGCNASSSGTLDAPPEQEAVLQDDGVSTAEFEEINDQLAAIDSIFQPLPLLRPQQEGQLRQFGNTVQLERAREVGIGPNLSADQISAASTNGDLVRLEETEYWIVRDLDYSSPWVVPAMHEFLLELGRRFQVKLGELNAPAFRFEVTSVLRSAADQDRLRETNPNAISGTSTHEFGTTVDIAYNGFAAPLNRSEAALTPGKMRILDAYRRVGAERVAARRALEIKALLGSVLLQLQDEGQVMVTLEELQPVFHMTVNR